MEREKQTKYDEYIKRTNAGYTGKTKKKITLKGIISGVKSFFLGILIVVLILSFFFIINGGPLVLIQQWINRDEPKVESEFEPEDDNKDGIVTPGEYQEYHQDYWERYGQ